MPTFYLKNSQIVTPKAVKQADIFIKDGKIERILEPGEDSPESPDEEIDCEGKIILPGLIDIHVHFRVPGGEYKEDFETGSMAAVAGGVTSVCDMPNNTPPITSLQALEDKRKLIQGHSYVNYGLYMGYDGSNIDEINKAENIPGVKLFFSNSTGDMGVPENSVSNLFENTDKFIVVHAEDEPCIQKNLDQAMAEYDGREDKMPSSFHSKIRASECAASAVDYLCKLAKKVGRQLHIAHVSCEAELDIIQDYKNDNITCEVAPHHLLLTEYDYEHLGNFIKMNPPVRSRDDIFAMWLGLKSGVIDIVATDHAPHTIEEKEQPYLKAPSGVPELDTLLPIMLNSVNQDSFSLEELVNVCCSRPAELLGIQNKGKIEEGYDADLVVVDMDLEKEVTRDELFSKCGWSPYEESMFKGWAVMTFVNGELIFRDGEIVGDMIGEELRFE